MSYGNPYILPSDVTNQGGRLALVFGTYTAPMQQTVVDRANAAVDAITGQDSLLLQTKTVALVASSPSRTVFLPNRPITAVTAIHVDPLWDQSFDYPVAPANIRLTGAQSFDYVIPNSSGASARALDVAPFQEGDSVLVTYTCGYATLPPTVAQAALHLVAAHIFSLMDNPSGADNIQVEQARQVFGSQTPVDRNRAAAYDILAAFSLHVPSGIG